MKISVITVNRNNRKGLLSTIDSVVSQEVRPYEFIIIDGASTDGSAELLEQYSNEISYSVSEPDNGIYNAMNKAISLAHGDYCIFMNSGDSFCGPAVIANLCNSGITGDIICGNAIIMESVPRRKKAPEEVTLRFLFGHALCHQSVLIRTDLLRKHPYDESLRIVADRKFFLQSLVFDACNYQPVDVDICNYDITGFSANNRFASEQEWQMVLREMIPERILLDYGRMESGALFGSSAYERMFLEIGRRNFRKPIYRLVRLRLSAISLILPSAKFVKSFPGKTE